MVTQASYLIYIHGQVHPKHDGRHLIQANLFWFHATKEGAANILQASFHVLWQNFI